MFTVWIKENVCQIRLGWRFRYRWRFIVYILRTQWARGNATEMHSTKYLNVIVSKGDQNV